MTPALLLAAAVACSSPYVVDGDTLQCGPERVRLFGVDAPELAHRGRPAEAWAVAARQRLEALTAGRVACREADNGRDRYGRLVAICSGPRTPDLGAALVREGLARDFPRYSRGAYATHEAQARRDRLGLWR